MLEPETGKVLAMVSKPDFDPGRINEDWDRLTAEDDTDSALYNRAAQGLYPPGSTFKIVTLLEYMRENPDYADFSYQCRGSVTEGKLYHQLLWRNRTWTGGLDGSLRSFLQFRVCIHWTVPG